MIEDVTLRMITGEVEHKYPEPYVIPSINDGNKFLLENPLSKRPDELFLEEA